MKMSSDKRFFCTMPRALVRSGDVGMAATRRWRGGRIGIQGECQVNIPLFRRRGSNSFSDRGEEDMKAYPHPPHFPLLATRRPRMHPLDYHRSSFSLFAPPHTSPLCPHSIHFHFPPQFLLQLLSFQPDLSIFPEP